MRRRLSTLAAAASLLVIAGCGTLYNLNVADCPHDEPPRVYGGVRQDLTPPPDSEPDKGRPGSAVALRFHRGHVDVADHSRSAQPRDE